MTQTKTAPRESRTDRPAAPRKEQHEPLPTWRNTRPRGNPEPDQADLARSRERLEALLGR